MYITNYVALALGLEGNPDPPLSVVQAAVAAKGYTGYVAPDYAAPAPPRTGTGGSGGTGGGARP